MLCQFVFLYTMLNHHDRTEPVVVTAIATSTVEIEQTSIATIPQAASTYRDGSVQAREAREVVVP